jgi:hypothetical protein
MARAGDSATSKTTYLIAYGLFFTGLFVLMLSVVVSETLHWPAVVSAFTRDIGLLLSAVMGGSILHEKLLRDEMLRMVEEQLDNKLEAKIAKPEALGSLVAADVHRLFCERPPGMTGIRRLNEVHVRRNYSGYYRWVNEQKSQELFFAGRSVLHRIDADIRTRTKGCAEDILFRRLKENSKITILFLDPRTDILERLAKEESQTKEAMLGDIASSLGICRRLYDILCQNFEELKPGSEITIRVYDRVPYFAYHKQDDEVIVGFYFLSIKGSSSAAYELVDPETKQVFDGHFVSILSESVESTLVEFDGARGRPNFNEALYEELYGFLEQLLGKEKTDELVNRRPSE